MPRGGVPGGGLVFTTVGWKGEVIAGGGADTAAGGAGRSQPVNPTSIAAANPIPNVRKQNLTAGIPGRGKVKGKR